MSPPPTNSQRPKRGAPKGNLNALKTGRSSKQLNALVERIFDDPDLLRLVQAFVGTPKLRDQFAIRAGETYARRLRRNKQRERRQLRHRFEWLPYYDEDEAPF